MKQDPCEPIVVVSGCDEGYVMPLAVTIRSSIDRLGANRTMVVYIIDGGIEDESKRRLEASWLDDRVSVHFVDVDSAQLYHLPVSEHVTAATYLRLLIPQLLPASVKRAIYLDADMLVKRDLGYLWDEPQGGYALLAVQDYAAPHVDSRLVLSNYEACRRYIGETTPIGNFQELGIDPSSMYFNGGLLVIDIESWRKNAYAEKMIGVLEEHRRHVLWWDQYALNVVLANSWRALDKRWNQGAHLFAYPKYDESPFDRQTFEQLWDDPWIVHFCSPSKPWHYFSRHAATESFYETLKRTQWHAFKPERPEELLRDWWGHHYKPIRTRVKSKIRRIKRSLRSNFKAA